MNNLLNKTDSVLIGISAFILLIVAFGFHVALPTWETTVMSIFAPLVLLVVLLLARRHDRNTDVKAWKAHYQQLEAWINLQHLLPSRLPLFGLRDGATSPDFLALYYRLLTSRKPSLVVECGAGISTLWSGYLLEKNGKGKVLTIEHDKQWIRRIRRQVTDHGLTDYIELLHVPLTGNVGSRHSVHSYDSDRIRNRLVSAGPIDLLFVDAPVEWKAREPVLDIFRQFLSDQALILMDDTDVPEMKAIVTKWSQKLGVVPEWIRNEKGAVIFDLAEYSGARLSCVASQES